MNYPVTRIALVLLALFLAGCGGGQATPDEIAQFDAEQKMTTQPVDCSTGRCK